MRHLSQRQTEFDPEPQAIVLPSLSAAGMSIGIDAQSLAVLLGKAALTGGLWVILGLGVGLASPSGRGYRRLLRWVDHR
jgi:hypothetical protein